MNDDRRKMLSEFLEERWREPYFSCTCHDGSCPSKMVDENRTFTTAQDMVDLAKKLAEVWKWDKFEPWAFEYFEEKANGFGFSNYIAWLMVENPARTCELVGEFLEAERLQAIEKR